jgi:mannitol-1-phosphate 5-dehydrogenase
MKLVLFGAGSIGRSFIGQLFSTAGWEVVFVDIDEPLIDELNRKGHYRVEIKDREPKTITVRNVRGVLSKDLEIVSDEVSDADLVATAVGKEALPHIMPTLAQGLKKRQTRYPNKPLDIVICENMRGGAPFFRKSLKALLPANYPIDEQVGFVETSIGKMVPIMSEHDREKDLLLVFAEAYNTLILDKRGFKGEIPALPGLDPRENISAYVDRKLFIHNMGHAVLGYVSHVFRKKFNFVWEAAEDPEVYIVTKGAMWESGRALIREYPDDFNHTSIGAHIEDLLSRFQNRVLGDTIYRTGRDLYRKLGPNDRLIGSIKICTEHGVIPRYIALGTACALFFRAADEEGNLYKKDRIFHELESVKGVDHILNNICRIEDSKTSELIGCYYEEIQSGRRGLASFIQ